MVCAMHMKVHKHIRFWPLYSSASKYLAVGFEARWWVRARRD